MKPENPPFDFKYFIDFALNDKISWDVLETVLDDHSKTLPKARELNKILLQQLKGFHKSSKPIQIKQDVDEISQVWINHTGTFSSKVDEIDSKKRNSRYGLQNLLETNQFDATEDETSENTFDHDLTSDSPDSNIEIEDSEMDSNVQINPKIKCGFCVETFANPLTFKKHMERAHENSSKSNKMDIKEYKSMKDPNLKCQNCDALFKTDKGLKNHQAIHAHENVLVNPEDETPEDGEMNDYTIVSSDQEEVTEWKSPDLQDKINHYQTNGKLFQCKMCSEACEASKLRVHVKGQHKTKKLHIECQLCGKIFNEESGKRIKLFALKKHEEMHRKQIQSKGSIKCEKCPKTFIGKSSVTRHMKIHDELREKAFQCESCHKRFFTSHGIKTHLERNHCKT